jgi:hypothetical protein
MRDKGGRKEEERVHERCFVGKSYHHRRPYLCLEAEQNTAPHHTTPDKGSLHSLPSLLESIEAAGDGTGRDISRYSECRSSCLTDRNFM